MEDDWEDESLVFVEFSGIPLGQLIPPGTQNQQAELLGVASDQPVMHINGQDFAGHYEDSYGTFLFLDRKDAAESDSKKSGSKDVTVEYFCKTDKKLVMNPAFLMEKVAALSEPASQPSTSTQDSSQTVSNNFTAETCMMNNPTAETTTTNSPTEEPPISSDPRQLTPVDKDQ